VYTELELYFRYRCEKGLAGLGLAGRKEYEERLAYEIGVIEKMGFASYFLVVADIINWAKNNQIPVGPGRGSAAGSLVAHSLGITHREIDPIKYNLLFERFLNPDRISMPDCDLDFCELRRNEVVQYLQDKYGSSSVAHIGTYGSMKAKAAIRDVARVLGYEYQVGDQLSRLVLPPIAGKPQPLSVSYEKVPVLSGARKATHTKEGRILVWSEKMEDRIRSFGTHACFTGKNKLLTVNGYRKFEDIKEQFVEIITKNGPRKAWITSAGTKDTIEILLKSGLHDHRGITLQLTPDHKVFSDNWVSAIDSVGRKASLMPVEFNDNISILAGWLWNDGHYSQANKNFTGYFTPTDDYEALELFSPQFTTTIFKNRPDKRLINSKVRDYIFSNFGVGCKENRTIKKPPILDSIYKKIAWLRGFISANGTVQRGAIRIKLASKELVVFIREALISLDIQCGNLSFHKPGTPKICGRTIKDNGAWQFEIGCGQSWKYANLIGFIQSYKQNKIKTKYFSSRNIKGFNFSKEETFDFTVLSPNKEDQNGYVNGVLVHNSGIVIANGPIADYIPLTVNDEGILTTQFEMNNVEEAGLLKFDLLGLRALTTIDHCIKLVKETTGQTIDIDTIPVDDAPTYELLRSGDTDGVFQMEGSSGIRDLVVQIRPTCLEDLAAVVAIFRPGPLGSDMLQQYLAVRAGRASPEYLVPELESILRSTGGWLIYQEQIIAICKQLAGYTPGEADEMRKIVGKKLPEKMIAQESKFKTGICKNGFSQSVADKLWSEIVSFAAYGFNLAHAVCYAYVGYQMAYLKTHYPLEFICSCLISDTDESDKILRYINYCRTHNVQILPPSINQSEVSFSIVKGSSAIRFGLGAIKNVGEAAARVIEERGTHGTYKSITDFITRLQDLRITKRQIESMICAGALDEFGLTRQALLLTADALLFYRDEYEKYLHKMDTYKNKIEKFQARETQRSNWDTNPIGKKPGKLKTPAPPIEPIAPTIENHEEMPSREKLTREREMLSCYVTGHPLDTIPEHGSRTISSLKEEYFAEKMRAVLIGIPVSIKELTTKTKKRMAYITLEDRTGSLECVVLPAIYEKHNHLLDESMPARYIVEVETIEGDTAKIVKGRVISISMLPSVKEALGETIQVVVPVTDALQAAKIIASSGGEEFRARFVVKTSDGSEWNLGTFWCQGNKSTLLSKLKSAT